MPESFPTRQAAVDAARDDLGELLAREVVTLVKQGCESCAGLGAQPAAHTLEVYKDLSGNPGDTIRIWVHEQVV